MHHVKEMSEEGLRRWEGWLEKAFPIACCRRDDLEAAGSGTPGDAVWQVQIRHGRHGRIRVAPDALGLDADEFLTAIQALERKNWYGALDQHLQIRIRGRGSVARVE